MNPDQRRIAQLESEVRDMRRRIEQIPRPVSAQGQGKTASRLKIIGGNNLGTFAGTAFTGILFSSSINITSLPSVSPDGNSATIYPNGLGQGYLLDDQGNPQGSPVWVINYVAFPPGGSANPSTTNSVVVLDQRVYSLTYSTFLVGSTGVKAYVLWR